MLVVLVDLVIQLMVQLDRSLRSLALQNPETQNKGWGMAVTTNNHVSSLMIMVVHC